MPSSFSDPERLLVLVVVAALAAGLLWRALVHRRLLRRWSSDALLASSAPRRPGLLRHLSAVLLVTALAATTVAWAGPLTEEEVERERATVVLAIDTSASMLAEDVAPDRFTAAKQAAIDFVADLPEGFDVALVGFAGTASVIVSATRDTDQVTRAIDRLQVAGGTALGDAVLTSLSAAAARPEGVPAVIVLLADGGSTAGTPVELAVAAAQEAEVPVTTIAYGTPEGVVVADGRRFEVPVDERALAEVAEPTGGASYTAATGDELAQVYDSIRGRLATTVEEVDISSRAVGLALLLMAVAAVPTLLLRQPGV
jgi:Ca-activated chloride channel family protein